MHFPDRLTACGLTSSMVPLIAFRTLQGLGAGAIQSIATARCTVVGRAAAASWLLARVWGEDKPTYRMDQHVASVVEHAENCSVAMILRFCARAANPRTGSTRSLLSRVAVTTVIRCERAASRYQPGDLPDSSRHASAADR